MGAGRRSQGAATMAAEGHFQEAVPSPAEGHSLEVVPTAVAGRSLGAGPTVAEGRFLAAVPRRRGMFPGAQAQPTDRTRHPPPAPRPCGAAPQSTSPIHRTAALRGPLARRAVPGFPVPAAFQQAAPDRAPGASRWTVPFREPRAWRWVAACQEPRAARWPVVPQGVAAASRGAGASQAAGLCREAGACREVVTRHVAKVFPPWGVRLGAVPTRGAVRQGAVESAERPGHPVCHPAVGPDARAKAAPPDRQRKHPRQPDTTPPAPMARPRARGHPRDRGHPPERGRPWEPARPEVRVRLQVPAHRRARAHRHGPAYPWGWARCPRVPKAAPPARASPTRRLAWGHPATASRLPAPASTCLAPEWRPLARASLCLAPGPRPLAMAFRSPAGASRRPGRVSRSPAVACLRPRLGWRLPVLPWGRVLRVPGLEWGPRAG